MQSVSGCPWIMMCDCEAQKENHGKERERENLVKKKKKVKYVKWIFKGGWNI